MKNLNQKQIALFAEFNKDLSLFFFGTSLAPLFAKVDSIDYLVIVLGLIDGFLFLACGIYLLKRNK